MSTFPNGKVCRIAQRTLVVLFAAGALISVAFWSFCCNVRPTVKTCRESNEVDAATKAELRAAGERVVTALRKDDDKAVMGMMHSSLQSTDKATLARLVHLMHKQLHASSPLVVDDVRLATVTNGSAKSMILCGSGEEENDSHLVTTLAVDGAGEVGMIRFLAANGTRTDAVDLHFVRGSGDWEIIRFFVGVAALSGNKALDYENRADEHRAAGRHIEALANYQLAAQLTPRLKGVTTGTQKRILRKLDEVRNHDSFQSELRALTPASHPVFRQRMFLVTVGPVPTFTYVSRHSLDDGPAIKAEAEGLKAELLRAHPDLANEFGHVTFEATTKVVPEGKGYEYYRVLLPVATE